MNASSLTPHTRAPFALTGCACARSIFQEGMIVIVEALSIRDLDALLDRIGALDGVERTMSSIILSTRIDR